MFKMKKIAGHVGAVLALSYAASASATLPDPGALGEAFMHFTNFQINVGNNAAGGSGVSAISLIVPGSISGNETATATASLNGVNAAPGNADVPVNTLSFSANATIGSGFGPSTTKFLPLTADNPVLGSGSGAYSSSDGAALLGGAEVYMHSLSQLNGPGITNASATQDVNATFSVVTRGGRFELIFDLDRFIRAGLGQDQFQASGRSTFSVTVTDSLGTEVLVWAPGGTVNTSGMAGSCVLDGTCDEYADAFSLQSGLTAGTAEAPIDKRGIGNTGTTQFGTFETEVTLAAGTYNFIIQSNVTSSARILQVPEPGSLALLGLGLLSAGFVARRKGMRV